MGDDRRDADREAGHRGDQRLGDAAGEAAHDTHALLLDDLKSEDHAPNGAKEAEERRDGGHGAHDIGARL